MLVCRGLAIVLVAGALLTLYACGYYDEDDRCGENMVFNEDAHICLCDSKSIKQGGGCERCPSGREPAGDKCVCPTGMHEDDAGMCEQTLGLGDTCDDDSPCTDMVYDYCAKKPDASEGTCTKRCTNDADCDETYTCADWEDMPYCKLFAGAGTSCTMPGPDDPMCTDDAPYCFIGQCFVTGCKVTENHVTEDCPKDRKCCDVGTLTMGAVTTACVALSFAMGCQ